MNNSRWTEGAEEESNIQGQIGFKPWIDREQDMKKKREEENEDRESKEETMKQKGENREPSWPKAASSRQKAWEVQENPCEDLSRIEHHIGLLPLKTRVVKTW